MKRAQIAEAEARRTYGAELRTCRVIETWTQAEIADRLGMTETRLSRLERGQARPRAKELAAIAKLFPSMLTVPTPRSYANAPAPMPEANA